MELFHSKRIKKRNTSIKNRIIKNKMKFKKQKMKNEQNKNYKFLNIFKILLKICKV